MDKKDFHKWIAKRVVFGDGAMGTELYRRGIFLNACFDELNLTHPKMVQQIHEDYIQAGSDFIETNTYGANTFKLSKYGLADKVGQINEAGVSIAKQVAGDNIRVAGSIGPTGISRVGLDHELDEPVRSGFAEQASALKDGGVDFLILETFGNTAEILLAIKAAAAICDLPLVTQVVMDVHSETVFGTPLEASIQKIAAEPFVDVVGLNCSIGPSDMLDALKRIREITDKPISVQPNAGLPREVEGRLMYMSTPEYMAEYAKRFFENGAAIIGGCCGTTPEHIRQIVKAVRAMDKAAGQKPHRPTIRVSMPEKPGKTLPMPFEKRSKIAHKLTKGETVTSIELLPPRGLNLLDLQEKVRICADYGIDAVNIPDGPRASSRLSPMATAVKVQQAAGIEAILHVCCRDKNIIGMQSDILGAEVMGVKNLLLITGDPPKLGEYPDATAVFDLDSIALARVVHNLNQGLDIAGNELGDKTSFTIAIGANPVASDLEREIKRFCQKVEAGAEYAVTQPVFDAKMLFSFIDEVADFKIPIVAGIWPFTSFKNAEFMANEVPGVVVPKVLLDRMSKAKTRQEGKKIGVQIARDMIEQIADHVAGFAVSAPFGNVNVALAALGKIPIDEI
jgi:methionine synthase I (cobalamin-dependent)/5,10-methylenetetrahydrofolate reductase